MPRKLTKRKAFNFLRSYFDVLNEIETDSDKLNYLLALINKQFLDEDPEGLSFIANLCYQSQRHSIETSIKGYKDKTKTDLQGNNLTPKQDPKQDPTQGGVKGGGVHPLQQEEEKEQEKEEVQVKVKEDKEAVFKKTLLKFQDKYEVDLLKEFFYYWTEKSDNGKKMRFELSKNQPFNTSRRLGTWKKNENKFGTPKTTTESRQEMNRALFKEAIKN